MEDRSRDLTDYHDRIPYLIGAISNVLAAGAARLYRDAFGMGLAETRLMWVMSHEPALTVQRASDIMGVDKAATSRALASLVQRGLVRVVVDERDNRRRIMVFSDAGGKMCDQIIAVSLEREHRLNAIFSEAERKTIRGLLNKLLANAREVSEFDPLAVRPTGQKRVRVKRSGEDAANVTAG
jgi:DNA-binding MarR family transcriptional regulator